MKRFISLVLIIVLLLACTCGAEQLDYASMSNEELDAIISLARAELAKRELVMGDHVLLFESNGLRVYLTGEYEFDTYDPGSETLWLDVFAVNESDVELAASCLNAYVNGTGIYGSGIYDIKPGKQKMDRLFVEVGKTGVSSYDQLQDIEFEFEILDQNTYDTIAEPEPVRVHFNVDGMTVEGAAPANAGMPTEADEAETAPAAAAPAEAAPQLDPSGASLADALAAVGTDSGRGENARIALNDDFSEYDYFSSDFYNLNTGKFIILRREGAEKKYSISTEPFADDYKGEDIGETKVYLCAELMEQIPEQYRAKTPDEVGNIIMIESGYLHGGTISSVRGSMFGSDGISERGLENAMNDTEIDPSEEEERVLEYKPVFIGYTMVALYNAQDGSSAQFDGEQFKYEELRRNPAAADVAEVLYQLGTLLQACWEQDQMTLYNILMEQLMTEEGYMDAETAYNLIQHTFAETPDFAAIESELIQQIWNQAAKVRDLDSENADLYDQVIAEQSINGLYYLINNGDYNGVRDSDAVISLTKAYMGKIDMSTLDAMTDETMAAMALFGWDIQQLYDAINAG